MKKWILTIGGLLVFVVLDLGLTYAFNLKWTFIPNLLFLDVGLTVLAFFIYERTALGIGIGTVLTVIAVVAGIWVGFNMNTPPVYYKYEACGDFWAIVHVDKSMGSGCTKEVLMAEIDGYVPIAGHDYRDQMKSALSKDLDELWRAERQQKVIQTFPRFRHEFGIFVAAYVNEARDRMTTPPKELSDIRQFFYLILFAGFIINNLLGMINFKIFGGVQTILALIFLVIGNSLWNDPSAGWTPDQYAGSTLSTLNSLWNSGFMYGFIPSLLGFIPQIGSMIARMEHVAKFWGLSALITAGFGAFAFYMDPRFQEIFLMPQVNQMILNDPNLNMVNCVWAILLGIVPGIACASLLGGLIKLVTGR